MCEMDKKGNFLSICLLDALEDENEKVAVNLLKHYKADPSIVIQDRGIAPIHYASGMENIEFAERIIALMLSFGGDPNVCSEDNMTPLHIASFYGRVTIVKMLLKHGGNVNVIDSEKKTPILYAVYEGHFEVLKAIQNHIFEKKIDAKKENIVISANVSRFESPSKNPSQLSRNESSGPINNNLLSVKNLEEAKFTPNRINYNFDVTSPYYINITHRRKDKSTINTTKDSQANAIVASTPLHDNEVESAEKRNLFELTEENVSELTNKLTPERSRISLIKSWREKVQKSRSRRSIVQKFNDIDSLLSGLMTNDNLDFSNTLLTLDESELDEPIVPKHSFNRTPLGKMLDDLRNARTDDESFKTAADNNESNFIKSPRNGQYIVQMSEAYVHTDNDNGLVFYETKLLVNPSQASNPVKTELDTSRSTQSTNITIPLEYETDALRAELTQFGEPPGPITKSTKKLYIKRLIKYKRDPERMKHLNSKNTKDKPCFSIELEKTVRDVEWFLRIPEYAQYETQMSAFFKGENRDFSRKLREGHLKQSFIYFLIDPRISSNLPAESTFMEKHDVWTRFINSIFYVGKGKSVRPYSHLYDALKTFSRKGASQGESTNTLVPRPINRELYKSPAKQSSDSKKIDRILDVWADGRGVVCLHVFHNILPAEAYTREAAIIDALGLQHLTNMKRGDYYGTAQTWNMRTKKCLGILLLFKAMQIFLAEGESQLSPSDLI